MALTPAEERKRIKERKRSRRNQIDTIDLEREYDSKKNASKLFFDYAIELSRKVKARQEQKKYKMVMGMEQYYSIHGRETLAKKFIGLMRFYEEINPNWKENYNAKENKKEEYKRAPLSEEYTMKEFVKEALNKEVDAFGKINAEDMQYIRVSALTVFYANKIAHYSKFLRERYLYHVLNYEITNNDALDDALSDEKDKEIYMNIREYYASFIDYSEAKINEDKEIIKHRESRLRRRKEALEKYGIKEDSKILNDRNLLRLVMLERDAYAIKDVAIANLKDELVKQEDISFGIKPDGEGKEVFVVDLPFYGQFSVHTKRETSAWGNLPEERKIKGSIPPYEYDIYGVEEGNILLVQAKTETMEYILRTWEKKNKRNIEDVLEVANIDEMDEIHKAAVKLGLTKAELSKIYELAKEQEDIEI